VKFNPETIGIKCALYPAPPHSVPFSINNSSRIHGSMHPCGDKRVTLVAHVPVPAVIVTSVPIGIPEMKFPLSVP